MEDLLTAQELAKVLNLSVETIWRYTRQKRIPTVELGGQYRYEKEAVITSLARRGSEGSVVKEESPVYSGQGGYTYKDYVKLPEEPGFRYEVLEGFLVKEPSPSIHHQRVSRELVKKLIAYFDAYDSGGELFFAPLDVTLTDRDVVQPDILFLSSSRKGDRNGQRLDYPCDFVVEIISASSRRKDRVQKMAIYGKAGIPHYWLVDPEACTLEAFVLKDQHYTLIAAGCSGDTFVHPGFPGLELDLTQIFYQPSGSQ